MFSLPFQFCTLHVTQPGPLTGLITLPHCDTIHHGKVLIHADTGLRHDSRRNAAITRKEKQPRVTPLILIFLVFCGLHIIPVLGGKPVLWGADQWKYLPGPVVFLFLLFGLFMVFPGFRVGLIRFAGSINSSGPVRRLRENRSAAWAVSILILAILFWQFRTATHFLGDGYVWAEHLVKDIVSREPVSSWLYRSFYRLFNLPAMNLGVSTITAAAILSVLSGLIFSVFAFRTATLLGGEKNKYRLFIFLAILSTGMMQFFFGYVETYPPFVASFMAFIYFSIRLLKGNGSPLWVILTYLITLALHLSAVVFLPGLAVMFWLWSGRVVDRKKYYAIIFTGVLFGLVVLWIFQHKMMFGGFFHEYFLPLFSVPPGSRIVHPLFSLKTVFELFNHLVLVCPIALFIFIGFKGASGSRDETAKKIFIFLETIVVFYILEFLVFNKLIGASRDWDLFAAFGVPLALLTALVLIDRYRRVPDVLVLIAAAVIIVHTAPFIGLNSRVPSSERRFIDLVDHGFWSNYARGYGYSSLGLYYKNKGDIQNAIRYLTAASDVDKGNVRYKYNLATIYFAMKDNQKAVVFYEEVIRRDPDYLEARNNLGVIYWRMGKLGPAEEQLAEIIKCDSTYVTSYEPLAEIYFRIGQMEKCVQLYRKAIELGHDLTPFYRDLVMRYLGYGEGDRSFYLFERMLLAAERNPGIYQSIGVDGMNNIGVFYGQRERLEDAARIFDKAISIFPDNPDLHVNMARTFFMLGDFEKTWKEVFAAERLGTEVSPGFLENLRKEMDRPSKIYRKKITPISNRTLLIEEDQ